MCVCVCACACACVEGGLMWVCRGCECGCVKDMNVGVCTYMYVLYVCVLVCVFLCKYLTITLCKSVHNVYQCGSKRVITKSIKVKRSKYFIIHT